MTSILAPLETRTIKSIDGLPIHVTIAGTGPHRWLLPPGLGTPVLCWKYLFEYFHEKMTIVTWDPRGCYQSGIPKDPERLRVESHVEDAFAVIDEMGWQDGGFVTGGWSMGVQIGLELFHNAPHMVRALTLINGAFENVLRTAFALPIGNNMMRGVAHVASLLAPLSAPVSSYLLGQDWALDLLKKLSIVSNNEDFFAEVAQQFKGLDFKTYFKMMLKLDEHSAREILPTVNVPTLVTAGSLDKMTPPAVCRFAHEQIPGSGYFEIPNGTHYTTIEYPEIVNLKLDQFFRTRVFADSWDNPSD